MPDLLYPIQGLTLPVRVYYTKHIFLKKTVFIIHSRTGASDRNQETRSSISIHTGGMSREWNDDAQPESTEPPVPAGGAANVPTEGTTASSVSAGTVTRRGDRQMVTLANTEKNARTTVTFFDSTNYTIHVSGLCVF